MVKIICAKITKDAIYQISKMDHFSKTWHLLFKTVLITPTLLKLAKKQRFYGDVFRQSSN